MNKVHYGGPVCNNHINVREYSALSKGTLKIGLDSKNNCVLLTDGTYVQCFNFLLSETNIMYLIGRPLHILSAFYKKPLDSAQ